MRNKMKTGYNVKGGRTWLTFSFILYVYTICEKYFEEINRLVTQLHTKTDLYFYFL